jgi:hypothetical protein
LDFNGGFGTPHFDREFAYWRERGVSLAHQDAGYTAATMLAEQLERARIDSLFDANQYLELDVASYIFGFVEGALQAAGLPLDASAAGDAVQQVVLYNLMLRGWGPFYVTMREKGLGVAGWYVNEIRGRTDEIALLARATGQADFAGLADQPDDPGFMRLPNFLAHVLDAKLASGQSVI